MFGLPQAKRVRREDLYSPPSSPRSSPDPALDDLLRGRLQQDYQFTTFTPQRGCDDQSDNEGAGDSGELEFRLFATFGNAAQAPVQKIRLRSPTPQKKPPGFLNGRRPRKYYFTDDLTPKQAARFRDAAVSGEDILARSKIPWPGCAYSWKVTRIAASGERVAQGRIGKRETVLSKRRRAGKKKRIAIRKRVQAEKANLELAAKSLADKEAAEREKQTKRNREKKVKKKERDKAKKAAAATAPTDGGPSTAVDGSSS